MKLLGEIIDISLDYYTNRPKITFLTDVKDITLLEELKGSKLNLSVSKWNKKRSLDSNGYLWVLLGELQDNLQIPKEELYKNYIKDIGDYEVLPVKNIAVDRFISAWSKNGLGWFCETVPSKLKGYTNILAYYGSSSYNSKQMTKLINLVIADCNSLGIETKSKEELDSLLGMEDKCKI